MLFRLTYLQKYYCRLRSRPGSYHVIYEDHHIHLEGFDNLCISKAWGMGWGWGCKRLVYYVCYTGAFPRDRVREGVDVDGTIYINVIPVKPTRLICSANFYTTWWSRM